MELQSKLEKLQLDIRQMGGVAVAFSGGVDSTFLLKVAYDILKDDAAAITARSSIFSKRELEDTVEIVKEIGARHIYVDLQVFGIEGFLANPENRCYLCKKEVFTRIRQVAEENNLKYVLDGSNVDDLGDYRPGMAALKELGIISPLRDAGLTKGDIRVLSKEMGLPTWDKPAFACLASRFPYGHEITEEKLEMVDRAEQYISSLGFRQLRVRHHGDIARIEVSVHERSRFFNEELMDRVHDKLKRIGFRYIALDLKGYRTGSLNEGILGKR